MASQLHVQIPATYGDLRNAGPGSPLLALMGLRRDCSPLLHLHLQMVLYAAKWRTEGLISPEVMHYLAYPASARAVKGYADHLAQAGFLERRGTHYYVPAALEWPVIRTGARDLIPDFIRQRVFERDGWQCTECGSGKALSLDHVIPWSRNGSDGEGNLRTLCGPCNSRKGARV